MKHSYSLKSYYFNFAYIICITFLLSSTPQLLSQEKPGATNTGPSGTLEAQSGGAITVDGTVVENQHITGCMHIKASNVVIRNCLIDANWDWYAIRCDYGEGYTNLLVEDCELIQGSSALIKGSDFTMRRCNLHESKGDAIKPASNCLVEYNWIHHLGIGEGAHADGVQSRDGGKDMVFRYNNFDMPFDVEPPYKSNSPFIVQTSNGIVSMLIEYNWINGGSYTMNLGKNEIVVRHNIFGKDYAYGIFYPGSDNFNSCNTWEDTEEPMDDCSGDTIVTGVKVKPNSVNLPIGENAALTAEVLPIMAMNKNVTWASDNEAVAIVDSNGKVTAVAEGTANITATTEDGGFSDDCLVAVTTQGAQPPAGDGGAYTLNPVEDAYVRDVYYSDRNFGTEKELHVKRSYSSQSMQTFLKFDLSQIMAANLETAVLRLYVKDVESVVKNHLTIVDDDTWTETGITHDNKPDSGEELVAWDLDSTQAGAYIELDIVEAVKSEAGEMMSLNIHTDEKIHRIATFTSRESDNKPELVINGGGETPQDVAVTGVAINPDVLEMETGETQIFVATVAPLNASNKSVQWGTTPTNLASIDNNGKLKALAEGTVTVTVKTVDGDFTATSSVTIVPNGGMGDTIDVSGIRVSVQNLNLSLNNSFILTAQVEPLNATIKTVTWTSADPSVVEVDDNGKITAVSYGTTTITATSIDGGFTATCTIEVLATEQLMNLDAPEKERFQLPLDLVWPDQIGQGHVCLWHKDRIAAASISIDDNIEFQHDWWMEMTKKYPDLVYTWMVMPSTVKSWDSFQQLIDLGHTVDAHDLCEINELPEDEYLARLAGNKKTINEKLTNNECFVFAYPCGDPRNTISRDLFICMRGTVGHMNHANKTNYLNLKSRSGLSYLHDIRVLLDEKEKLWSSSYKRGWLSYHYHKVGNEEGAEKFLAELQLKSDSIWTGSHAHVAKYGQERDTHTLTVEEVTNEKIQFRITDKMYDEIFDFPLTIKFRVPDSWISVASTQDGKPVGNEIIEKSGKKYVYVYPVPDRGTVIINATEKDPDIEDPSDTTNVEEPGDITTSIQHNVCKVNIWPNPATSGKELSLCLDGFIHGQKLAIKIIDGMGRQVYNQSNTITQGQMTLPLKLNGKLHQGYYILQISDGTHSLYKKLLMR